MLWVSLYYYIVLKLKLKGSLQKPGKSTADERIMFTFRIVPVYSMNLIREADTIQLLLIHNVKL